LSRAAVLTPALAELLALKESSSRQQAQQQAQQSNGV
jgi:hypothetical protein